MSLCNETIWESFFPQKSKQKGINLGQLSTQCTQKCSAFKATAMRQICLQESWDPPWIRSYRQWKWRAGGREIPGSSLDAEEQAHSITTAPACFSSFLNATRLSEALERPPWVHCSALGDPGFSLNTVNIEWKVQKKKKKPKQFGYNPGWKKSMKIDSNCL